MPRSALLIGTTTADAWTFVSIGVGTAVGVAKGKVLGRVEGRVDDELVEGDLVAVGLAVAPGPPMNPP
jgi:hypothetical protein